jgi:rhodanese-related sulfurtransferase
LHCAAGVRVHAAAPILESMGFKRVVPLQEGFGLLVHLGVDEAV